MSRTYSTTTSSIGALVAAHISKTASRCRRQSGAQHRTDAPVRRGSLEAGTFEDTFFSVPAEGETSRLMAKARKLLDAANALRRKARAGEKLTVRERKLAQSGFHEKGLRVYEEILTIARLQQGRIYPSFDWLADATAIGRRTVIRAVEALEKIGLVERQRRFTLDEKSEPGRPQYRQTSNAYRLTFAETLVGFLPRWMQPAPTPDDVMQREADRLEDTDHMLSQLTCRELARATVSGPMGAALARFGDSLDRHNASATMAQNRR